MKAGIFVLKYVDVIARVYIVVFAIVLMSFIVSAIIFII